MSNSSTDESDTTSEHEPGIPPQQQTSAPHTVVRSVKSFRIRDDLSHQIEIRAAIERRKIYEIVEEAFEWYLARHEP